MKQGKSQSAAFSRSDQLLAELEVLLKQLEKKRSGLNHKVMGLLSSNRGRKKAAISCMR